MAAAGGDCYTEIVFRHTPVDAAVSTLRFLFTHHDDDYSRNARLVARASRASGVSEYDLFHLAYQAWYGGEPEQQRLEKIFVHYLFSGRVPVWVKDFAQRACADTDMDQTPGALRWCLEILLLGSGDTAWHRREERTGDDRFQA